MYDKILLRVKKHNFCQVIPLIIGSYGEEY